MNWIEKWFSNKTIKTNTDKVMVTITGTSILHKDKLKYLESIGTVFGFNVIVKEVENE